MCRIAYFGTDGCLGHHFKAISGRFSPQEKEDLSKIDEDFQLFGFSGFNFFTYKGYGCLSFCHEIARLHTSQIYKGIFSRFS